MRVIDEGPEGDQARMERQCGSITSRTAATGEPGSTVDENGCAWVRLNVKGQTQWIEALDAGSGDSDFRLRCQGASHDWAGRTYLKASDALKAGCSACDEIRDGQSRLAGAK